jgi:glutathione peroxidase
MPMTSFYELHDTLIDGTACDFSQFKGKKVMLINTASDCGYTGQYASLEDLHQHYGDKLIMLAFPANDFGAQEQGSNEEIYAFCQKNYGVTFPLMQKSIVVKGQEQNPVFQWLTDPAKNGWNEQPPSWNFCKYLVNEEGKLINYWGASIEPFSEEVIDAIEK